MKRWPWKEKAMSNDIEAARLLKISADKGNADARFELGLFYLDGRGGLPKDREAAFRLFMLAARQGHIRVRQYLEDNAPRMPIAKWLYTRRWVPQFVVATARGHSNPQLVVATYS
jgi:TPR repeat protein